MKKIPLISGFISAYPEGEDENKKGMRPGDAIAGKVQVFRDRSGKFGERMRGVLQSPDGVLRWLPAHSQLTKRLALVPGRFVKLIYLGQEIEQGKAVHKWDAEVLDNAEMRALIGKPETDVKRLLAPLPDRDDNVTDVEGDEADDAPF